MKSCEERDAMVGRVQAAAKKWPTFEAMPFVEIAPVTVDLKGDPAVNAVYVEAPVRTQPQGRNAHRPREERGRDRW